ncbi:MAG: hypothetical protein ACK53L_20860, partial [Pirellulaceae bacterium]
MLCAEDLKVKTLGNCRIDSPLMPLLVKRQSSINYADESDRVMIDTTASSLSAAQVPIAEMPG